MPISRINEAKNIPVLVCFYYRTYFIKHERKPLKIRGKLLVPKCCVFILVHIPELVRANKKRADFYKKGVSYWGKRGKLVGQKG